MQSKDALHYKWFLDGGFSVVAKNEDMCKEGAAKMYTVMFEYILGRRVSKEVTVCMPPTKQPIHCTCRFCMSSGGVHRSTQ